MTICSMTGYGRADAEVMGLAWSVELKSVNGKGLEIRSRIPNIFDPLEAKIRQRLSCFIKRGNVTVSINLKPGSRVSEVVINEDILESYVKAVRSVHERFGFELPRAADLLALRGVSEMSTYDMDEEMEAGLTSGLEASLDRAAEDLNHSRQAEGARLVEILRRQIDTVAMLVERAETQAALQPVSLQKKLEENVSKLLSEKPILDPERLAQEVALLATKADVTEELDRLKGHVDAAREIFNKDAAIGRAFDFLAQEFFREANTLCSKSIDRDLTRIGLELKSVIEQIREQVKNLE